MRGAKHEQLASAAAQSRLVEQSGIGSRHTEHKHDVVAFAQLPHLAA